MVYLGICGFILLRVGDNFDTLNKKRLEIRPQKQGYQQPVDKIVDIYLDQTL